MRLGLVHLSRSSLFFPRRRVCRCAPRQWSLITARVTHCKHKHINSRCDCDYFFGASQHLNRNETGIVYSGRRNMPPAGTLSCFSSTKSRQVKLLLPSIMLFELWNSAVHLRQWLRLSSIWIFWRERIRNSGSFSDQLQRWNQSFFSQIGKGNSPGPRWVEKGFLRFLAFCANPCGLWGAYVQYSSPLILFLFQLINWCDINAIAINM